MRLKGMVLVNILLVLILFFLGLGSSLGCQNNETTTSRVSTIVSGKSFIWKITSGSTHIYLLGSVHVASEDLYPLDNTIEDAFSLAKYLVVEVNTTNITQESSNQLLMKYGLYSQGDGFKKNVPEHLYNQVDELFQKYGLVLALLDDYKPFVIYNFMSQLILQSLGYMAEYGLDFYCMDKAEKSGKNILELETVEYQMNVISSVPDEVIIEMMQYDIDNPETEQYLEDLFSAWLDGDALKMETTVFKALVDVPTFAPYYELMYNQRNLDMLLKIENFLADNEVYFIIVGAGHLVGDNGLIKLLTDRGYTVEQLNKSG